MSNNITFFYGTKPVTISFYDGARFIPTDTVLFYLREELKVKATREGCGVGDCGACTVVLAELIDGKFFYYAVNSCLMMLPALNGKWLITANSLTQMQRMHGSGDDVEKLHPVQRELLNFYGVQCGFCTSGMLMSMFAIYKNFTAPSVALIEECMAGNLCRCTGYRPIIDACIKACTGEDDAVTLFEPKVKKWIDSYKKEDFCAQNFYKPVLLNNALKYYSQECVAICGSSEFTIEIKKKGVIPNKIMDISGVKELREVIKGKNGITIGAALPIERFRRAIKERHPELYKGLGHFASHQIRNVAAIAGNIACPSPISDSVSMLMAHNAVINTALEEDGVIIKRSIPIESFVKGYRKSVLRTDEMIISITLPYLQKNERVKFYKVSKREMVDISTLNLGAYIQLDNQGNIKEIKLYYGGMAEMVKRGRNAEEYMMGKNLPNNNSNMLESNTIDTKKACSLLRKDFTPISDVRATAQVRMKMAENLLELFINDLIS